MRKVFACLFALVGIVLLLGTGVLSFRALNAPTRLVGPAVSAGNRTEAWAAAVTAGDYGTAGKLMYGQPDLLSSDGSGYAVGEILWKAYQQSLCLEFTGECCATDSGISREMTVTALDISAVMKRVKEQINPALGARAEAALDKNVIFDENNAYREAFVMETLCDVTRQVLKTEQPAIQRTIKLELVFEEGQWWILPQQELIRLLSGVPGKGA